MSKALFVPNVVLIRHAQSEWNRAGRFTGWADPALTDLGRHEAVRAGRALAAHGMSFDRAFTSRLTRARDTAGLVLQAAGDNGVPLTSDWRLNERHYGALQGVDREAKMAEVGEAQVWRWRRGYLDRPPALADDDPRHPRHAPMWQDIPRDRLPNGENLAQTRERVMAFWDAEIVPLLQRGERLLISSHGNTLRALLMGLDDMSVETVESFEIPTGAPIVYAFSSNAEPLGWTYLDADRRAA